MHSLVRKDSSGAVKQAFGCFDSHHLQLIVSPPCHILFNQNSSKLLTQTNGWNHLHNGIELVSRLHNGALVIDIIHWN